MKRMKDMKGGYPVFLPPMDSIPMGIVLVESIPEKGGKVEFVELLIPICLNSVNRHWLTYPKSAWDLFK